MKKLKNLKFLLLALSTQAFCAGGNIADKLANSVNTEVTNAGKSIASMLNTGSIVFGILWIIVMLFMIFFNMEALKNNMKLLIGAVIIIGIIYGLSAASM